MRRPPFYLVLAAVIGLVLTACASPSGDGGGASTGGEPSSAAESDAPGASQGGGNGGDGDAPVLADGSWTGGEADVDVSGAADVSFSAQISLPSGTSGGATSLIYTSESGSLIIGINAEDAFGVAVTTTDLVVGEGTAEDCSVDYRQADDSRIEGTFRCDNADGVGADGLLVGTVTLEGSFTATR
jgi:hypothetical protein